MGPVPQCFERVFYFGLFLVKRRGGVGGGWYVAKAHRRWGVVGASVATGCGGPVASPLSLVGGSSLCCVPSSPATLCRVSRERTELMTFRQDRLALRYCVSFGKKEVSHESG